MWMFIKEGYWLRLFAPCSAVFGLLIKDPTPVMLAGIMALVVEVIFWAGIRKLTRASAFICGSAVVMLLSALGTKMWLNHLDRQDQQSRWKEGEIWEIRQDLSRGWELREARTPPEDLSEGISACTADPGKRSPSWSATACTEGLREEVVHEGTFAIGINVLNRAVHPEVFGPGRYKVDSDTYLARYDARPGMVNSVTMGCWQVEARYRLRSEKVLEALRGKPASREEWVTRQPQFSVDSADRKSGVLSVPPIFVEYYIHQVLGNAQTSGSAHTKTPEALAERDARLLPWVQSRLNINNRSIIEITELHVREDEDCSKNAL